MTLAELLLAAGLACVLIGGGMNIVTAVRYSSGKTDTKDRRVRRARAIVVIGVVGIACLVAARALL